MTANSSLTPTAKGAAHTAAHTKVSSLSYKWYKVNDSGGPENEVTGINDSDGVVGNYTSKQDLTSSGGTCSGNSGGTCSDCPLPSSGATSGGIGWTSYTSPYQYGTLGPYQYYAQTDFPDAEWQYLNAISDRVSGTAQSTVEVGCVVYFSGEAQG